MALLSEANVFVPQINENDMTYFKKVVVNNTPLPLPEDIKNEKVFNTRTFKGE